MAINADMRLHFPHQLLHCGRSQQSQLPDESIQI
jgi:hypothetical protein